MVKHNLYTKIFRQLRSYLISPNLNVWNGLRKRLFNKDFPDKISQLKDYSTEPPPELFEKVLETYQQMQLQSKFSKLKNLEEQPVENAFDNIVAILEKERGWEAGIVRTIVPFYKKMIAAAALIIVLVSCFFLLTTNNSKNIEQPYIVENSSKPSTDSLIRLDSNIVVQPDNNLVTTSIFERPRYKSYHFNATNHLSFNNVSIDGSEVSIEDNDLLYSFTKYPHMFGKNNPWDNKKGTLVKLNSYTDISISPFMSSVIGDLYKLKKNGRETRKAKRAKAKINRWRKADIKRFDKKKLKNPLDIIDLGENVY